MKKIITLYITIICVLLTCTSCIKTGSVSALHINSKTIRLESDMSKKLSIVTTPDNASPSSYELVSENEFVAVCDNNSVRAINEGETFIYAVSTDGKIKSNKVKVIVNNEIFEVAAKIITLSENKVDEDLKDVAITPKSTSQITLSATDKVPEAFVSVTETTEDTKDTEDVVYITKSGSKYHKQTCAYAQNASPVPRMEALSKGLTPCQKCKP